MNFPLLLSHELIINRFLRFYYFLIIFGNLKINLIFLQTSHYIINVEKFFLIIEKYIYPSCYCSKIIGFTYKFNSFFLLQIFTFLNSDNKRNPLCKNFTSLYINNLTFLKVFSLLYYI